MPRIFSAFFFCNENRATVTEIEVTSDRLTVTVKWHDGTTEGIYHTWGIQKTDSE